MDATARSKLMAYKEKCDRLGEITLPQTLGAASALKEHPEVKRRVHPDVKGGNEIQTLEILQIPPEMTRARVLELLCFLDPTALDPETFTRGGQILMKNMRAGDGSASWCP